MKGVAIITMLAVLAGCASTDSRPQPKPAQVDVTLPAGGAKGATLARARVSTKSGVIEILEPDGTITKMYLDSGNSRAALTAAQDLQWSEGQDMPHFARPGPTVAEVKMQAFAARSQPLLPHLNQGVTPRAADFIASQVVVEGDNLARVRVDMDKGVDASLPFAYATCALAGWAKTNGYGYARHVRTLADRDNSGQVMADVAYTLSKARPVGLQVMETRRTLRECARLGIPAA